MKAHFVGEPDRFSRMRALFTLREARETRLQKLLRWFREAYRDAREQARDRWAE